MPTILTHPAVPLALGAGFGSKHISPRLLVAGILLAILPDLDVVAFRLGIPYTDGFGHRGFSHSLLLAALVAAMGAGFARTLHTTALRAFTFLFVAMASHGLLDAFTSGGQGVAFLWPWSETRFFAPVRPIRVAPIGLSAFLSARGLTVLRSELLWVWLPAATFAGTLIAARLGFRSKGSLRRAA